jgi:hypothetical protein
MQNHSSQSRRQALAMLAAGAAALAFSAAAALALRPIAPARAAEPPAKRAAGITAPFDLAF